MQIDLEQVAEGGTTFASPICIVGAGVAGLILARKLADAGCKVALLEAGGLELEERSQSLYNAEMAAETHEGTTAGRYRTFGGSSVRWGGQLLPFTPDIFTPAAGTHAVAWPISLTEIEEHFNEIQDLFQVGRLPFDQALLPALGHSAVAFAPTLRPRWSKWAPFQRRNLAQTLGPGILNDPNITVYTHANVAGLEGDGTKIESASVLDYAGRKFRFTAERWVVCCGTVESSRLLLCSSGVPNPHDQVGRYFHDHLSFHAAVVPSGAREQVMQRLGPFFVDGTLHTVKVEATPELQQEAGLHACMAHFVIEEPEDSGIAAVRNLLTSIQRGRVKEAVTKNLLPLFAGLGDVLKLVWASKVQKRRAVSRRALVRMNIDMEQPATPENRIRLGEAKDALGLPKAVVEWKIRDGEYRTAHQFAGIIKQQWEQLGIAAFDWLPGLLDGEWPRMADTYHPMGGLRMGTDPAGSVVDANLKVHGLSNLFVASCAVFPSGGSSNPTFTMIALTLRLARRLAAEKKTNTD